MELYIAGGCGEHGRNCFHVTGGHTDFLVDCGLMAGEINGYPRLLPQEIPHIQTVFLTHSHADHTGALPWLYENGFQGEVVASEHTLGQLPFRVERAVPLECLCPSGIEKVFHSIGVRWGKSGHCLGSVWYHFETEGKSLLFSGDYTENSPVYRVDPIGTQEADLAIIDCAYGNNTTTYDEACLKLIRTVKGLLQEYESVVLPIPKYGRGLDLLSLFLHSGLNFPLMGDAHFLTQLQTMSLIPEWYLSSEKDLLDAVHPYMKGKKGITFVSDPQLRSVSNFNIAMEIIKSGGIGLMTGTVEKGTNCAALIEAKKMIFCSYPVHMNYTQYEQLVRKNHFALTVPYHSAELAFEKTCIEI